MNRNSKSENAWKQKPLGSDSTSDTEYPCVLPGVKIKPEYCKFFKYVHHKDSFKIIVSCQLKIPSDDDNIEEETEHILCLQKLSIDVGVYGNLKRHLKVSLSVSLIQQKCSYFNFC